MTENYSAVCQALDLSRDEVLTLARNGIDASFASETRKQELVAALTKFEKAN